MYTHSPQSWCCWQFVCEIFRVEICKICWFGKVWTAVNICRYPNLTNPSVIPKCLSPLSKTPLNWRIVTKFHFIYECLVYQQILSENVSIFWIANMAEIVYSLKVFEISNPLAYVFYISRTKWKLIYVCLFICFTLDSFHISSLFVGLCSSGFWLEPLLP